MYAVLRPGMLAMVAMTDGGGGAANGAVHDDDDDDARGFIGVRSKESPP